MIKAQFQLIGEPTSDSWSRYGSVARFKRELDCNIDDDIEEGDNSCSDQFSSFHDDEDEDDTASGDSKNNSGKRLSKLAVRTLIAWMVANNDDPYPNQEDKARLSTETGLTSVQVGTWMTNMRKRHVLPVLNRRRQPVNRLDHLFLAIRNVNITKRLRVVEAIKSGAFFKVTRHRMKEEDFEKVFALNFTSKKSSRKIEHSVEQMLREQRACLDTRSLLPRPALPGFLVSPPASIRAEASSAIETDCSCELTSIDDPDTKYLQWNEESEKELFDEFSILFNSSTTDNSNMKEEEDQLRFSPLSFEYFDGNES